MRSAFARHTAVLHVTPDGPAVWGWFGRTLSRRVRHHAHGECWLRLADAPQDKASGKIWEGNRRAAELFDGSVRKPVLYSAHEDSSEGYAYLAELTEFVSEPALCSSPVLLTDPELPQSWWDSLRADLGRVAGSSTARVAVRQEWADRCVPRFLGIPAPRIAEWETAHGDLHAANLTRKTPYLLDWEGFGRAPVGYDAAMLLAYSALSPRFTGRVRENFPILRTEAGRVAQLVVVTELMQSAERGDYPELVPALRALVACV